MVIWVSFLNPLRTTEEVWQEKGRERWVWFSIELSGKCSNGDIQGVLDNLDLEFRMEGGAAAVDVGFGRNGR